MGVIVNACQTRETSAAVIAATLATRKRVWGRAVLAELLDDLATGACSVLERGYLDLERRHGLPTVDRRQTPTRVNGQSAYRDVDHSDFGLIVELDGRAFRDGCRTIAQIAALLERGGWPGPFLTCLDRPCGN